METSSPPANGAPAAPEWRERAATCTGVTIGFAEGGVQFIGRHRLAISDEVVEIPFLQLANIIANILGALDPAHPAHAEILRSIVTRSARLAPAITVLGSERLQ